jgi:hypothetical protein
VCAFEPSWQIVFVLILCSGGIGGPEGLVGALVSIEFMKTRNTTTQPPTVSPKAAFHHFQKILKREKSVGEIVFGGCSGSDFEDAPENILPEWIKYDDSDPKEWMETLKGTKNDAKPLLLRPLLHYPFSMPLVRNSPLPLVSSLGEPASQMKLPRPPKRVKDRRIMQAPNPNARLRDHQLHTVNLKKMSELVDMKLASLRHNAMEYNNFMNDVEGHKQRRMVQIGVSAIKGHSQRMKDGLYEPDAKQKLVAQRAEELRRRMEETQSRKRDRIRMESEKKQKLLGKREKGQLESRQAALLVIVFLTGARRERLANVLEQQRGKRPLESQTPINVEAMQSISARIVQRAWLLRSNQEAGRVYRNALKVSPVILFQQTLPNTYQKKMYCFCQNSACEDGS